MTANDHEETPMEPAAPPTTIDFEALVRARITLWAEAERRYKAQRDDQFGAMCDGVVYQQLQAAETAIFQALNVLSIYGDDPGARRLLHARVWPPPAEDE